MTDATLGSAKFSFSHADYSFSSVGSYSKTFTATGTSFTFYRDAGAADITIDNVVITELQSVHGDSSGNNNDLTINGATKLAKRGYSFDGTDDYFTLTNQIAISDSIDWFFGFVWKYDGSLTDKVLLGSTATGTGYVGRNTSGNDTDYYVIFNGVASFNVSFSEPFKEGAVYYIFMSYDASTKMVTVTRFGPAGIEVKTGDLSVLGTWSMSLDLVGKRGNNSRYLKGNLKQLSSNSSALNPTQIRDLYQRLIQDVEV